MQRRRPELVIVMGVWCVGLSIAAMGGGTGRRAISDPDQTKSMRDKNLTEILPNALLILDRYETEWMGPSLSLEASSAGVAMATVLSRRSSPLCFLLSPSLTDLCCLSPIG